LVTPISVPAVSKKSTNSIVNTTTGSSAVNSSGRLTSASPKVGASARHGADDPVRQATRPVTIPTDGGGDDPVEDAPP
jgi:hypothetical protein